PLGSARCLTSPLWAHARRLRLAAEGAVSSRPSLRGGQRAQPPSQSDYYESAFDAATRKIVTLCTVSPALAAAATIPPISPGCGGGGRGDVSAGAATPRLGFGPALQLRQVKLAEALGADEDIDLGYLPVPDREAHDRERPSTPRHNGSGGPVHQRRPHEREQPPESERLLGHRPCATDLPRYTRGHDTPVSSDHDVGVEQREERVEVTVAGGGEEGADDLLLADGVGVGARGRPLHPAAGAAGEEPGRVRGSVRDGGDLVEGHAEHVVQHEREPLGRGQGVE